MVSFICDQCQSTLKKAKVQSHSWQCSSHSFSCIDCGVSFTPQSYNSHTQCISEAEKYQGALYKGKKHQPNNQPQQQPAGQKRASDAGAQQQQASKKQKQQTSVEEERKEEQLTAEQSVAELLPGLLQAESTGMGWKQLSKAARKLRPEQDKRVVEEELWTALQQHRKQLTFSWTLTQ